MDINRSSQFEKKSGEVVCYLYGVHGLQLGCYKEKKWKKKCETQNKSLVNVCACQTQTHPYRMGFL